MSIVKCGYLKKEGHNLKNWKRRFCVLHYSETVGCGFIAYYKNDDELDGYTQGLVPLNPTLNIEGYGEPAAQEDEKGFKGFKRKLIKMGSKASLVSSGRHLGDAGWKMKLEVAGKKVKFKFGAESSSEASEWKTVSL